MTNDLSDKLTSKQSIGSEPKPEFFDLSKEEDQDHLNKLLEEKPHIKTVDTYETQLLELFVLNNPPLYLNPPLRDEEFAKHKKEHYVDNEPYQAGKWVYLSWRHSLLHILDDEGYQQVRTGRNRNLITAEEQVKYYNSTVGIGGLSVGNSIALSLILTGGAKHIKLADPDTLELTNLNRIRSSIAELTEPKVYLTARQIYELDPYADITLYTEGITEENIEEFMDGLDLVIDEVDNLDIKIRIRQEAKARKIPVVMATDNGDSGLLDIERHDLKDDIVPFHGRAGDDVVEEYLGKQIPLPVLGKLIGEKLVGFDVTEPRMQQSLLEIGRSIPTWPQLGGAAVLNGVVVAAAVRKILTNQPVIDERAILSMSSWLIPGYDEEEQVKQRQQDTEQFTDKYNKAIETFINSQK